MGARWLRMWLCLSLTSKLDCHSVILQKLQEKQDCLEAASRPGLLPCHTATSTEIAGGIITVASAACADSLSK